MKSKLPIVLTVAVGCLLTAAPIFAHHAGSFYDRNHPVSLTGTVTEFEFTNPHVRIHFDVKDENGVVTNWVAESAPPQRIYRAGWNRNSLKPGDTITVDGLPSKDGKKWLSIQKLVSSGGKVLTAGAE
jgi:uncharacterized protein DUF6152